MENNGLRFSSRFPQREIPSYCIRQLSKKHHISKLSKIKVLLQNTISMKHNEWIQTHLLQSNMNQCVLMQPSLALSLYDGGQTTFLRCNYMLQRQSVSSVRPFSFPGCSERMRGAKRFPRRSSQSYVSLFGDMRSIREQSTAKTGSTQEMIALFWSHIMIPNLLPS